MALSLTERATGRAEKVVAAVRGLLRQGASQQALNRSLFALQSEAAKKRRREPAAGALIDAELAGHLAGIAASLHSRKAVRLPGSPRVPRPEDLLAVFADSFERALTEDDDA
jgi:hypothetical protein